MSEQPKKGLSKKYLYYKLLRLLDLEEAPDFHKICADHFERLLLYYKEIDKELRKNQ